MAEGFNHLSREDLFLLMESYRNMIQMHTTIVEQQKQIIELQNNLITKQDSINIKQESSYNQLNIIIEKVEECSENLSGLAETLKTTFTSIEKSMNVNSNSVVDYLNKTELENTKQHSGINNRIYASMGVMVTIIISLIGLIMTMASKFDVLQQINTTIMAIARFLKI